MSGDDFDLTGRVAVLTGGAGIIGSRLARSLVRHNARVAVLDRSGERLHALRKGLQSEAPGSVQIFEIDVADLQSLTAARLEIEKKLGFVEILSNNLATKTENFFAPFETFPLADWNEVLRVNLTAPMLACQVFGPGMAERGKGSIINTLSIYGIVAPDNRIYEGSMYEGRAINTPAVYTVSKAGLLGLTRYLASYWGHRGVRVNSITPGGVFSGQNETFVSRYSARVPLGRMATKDEMCGALIFLASDASSYVTGHNLVVDGGLTAW